MNQGRRRAAAAAAVSSILVASGCTGSAGSEGGGPTETGGPTTASSSPADTGVYSIARSEPVEDSVYPDRGDERIDTLHHDLDLDWHPRQERLVGRQEITFRAAEDAEEFVLDLGAGLEVGHAELDGVPVEVRHEGDVLTVPEEITEDEKHVLTLRYAGLADPAPAPTDRADFDGLGFRATEDGQALTMQQPYGAFTWYAVNDQPADKALYDLRLSVPRPWVGVSNGELLSRTRERGRTVTEFVLAEPASSYLMTVAFGPYRMTEGATVHGTPITYWTPRGRPGLVSRLQKAPEGLRWLEERLGDYPFDTLGFLVVPGLFGMESQTMITLGGDDPYPTSPPTLVHEMAHQWWGDQVSPCDWRDVWMNEGMATYLQTLWTDTRQGLDEGTSIEGWSAQNDSSRSRSGPPGDYDPDQFAADNVYVPPATMWHELRGRLGEETFWRLVREWPQSQDNTCSDRTELVAWWSEQSGEDLSGFFEAWLMGETDPE